MNALELHGQRVRLRPLRSSDRDGLRAFLVEPGVFRWWVHENIDAAVDGLFDDEESVRFAIEVEGELAGFIQFVEENEPDYRHAGIDLFVGTAWQARGIGPEAIRVVARHLFDERGHHRITIDPAAANDRAIRAYEKVGFRRVGIMRRYERDPDLTWHDGLLMDLLAGELLAPDDQPG